MFVLPRLKAQVQLGVYIRRKQKGLHIVFHHPMKERAIYNSCISLKVWICDR